MALKYMNTIYQKEIIQLFKDANKGTFICQQCKRTDMLKFNPAFLRYDTNRRICSDCEKKIEAAVEDQKVQDKLNALGRFQRDVLPNVISSMIESSGVPVTFRNAKMSDLGEASSKAFGIEESYFLTGGVGVGKSHMVAALIRQYLESLVPEYDEQRKRYYYHDIESRQPIFIEVPELLLRIRDTYNNMSGESEKDIVDYFTQTPFLVLDDLGTEKASEFSTLMIYLIINRRSTSGKTTVITSNLELIDIRERLSERISSRIKGMCREVIVDGSDKRTTHTQHASKDSTE